MSKQGYILRYYLPVPPVFDAKMTELRFLQLLDFCRENGVGAVMLYVALDPNWYYMPDTVAECRAQRDLMRPYIARLRAAGISYQLNFQNLIGSVPGGADFTARFPWRSLVDHKGRAANGCACPRDEAFWREAEERLALWAETEPDVIWIDDDLRLHNHGTPVLAAREGVGSYRDHYCFCDACLAAFNAREGTDLTRAELLCAMLRVGEPDPVREKYLDFLNETVVAAAARIRAAVVKRSPRTRLAQMTSKPDVHAAEGRVWGEFFTALCGEDRPMLRPHFGPYMEGDPREFVSCYAILAQTMAQVGPVAEYCPEVENTRFTVWSKSAAATEMQLSLSAFMGCRNVTLSLYDLDGGALDDEPAYGKMLRDGREKLERIQALDLADAPLLGVVLPTDPNSARQYRLREGEGYAHIGGRGRGLDTYLLKMGVPCRYLMPNEIDEGRDAVALDAYSAGFLGDAELSRILRGAVLLDGGAVRTLVARGFGELIGVKTLRCMDTVANREALHGVSRADGTPILVPLRTPCHAWYAVEYGSGVQVLSSLYTPLGECVSGLGYFENSAGGRVLICPLEKSFGDGFFTHHRVAFWKQLLGKLSADVPCVKIGTYALTVVKKSGDGVKFYFVANLSADKTEGITVGGKRVPCKLSLFESAVLCEREGQITRVV